MLFTAPDRPVGRFTKSAITTRGMTMTNAMAMQVGGDHYVSQKMQPWQIIDLFRLDFYEGNALKYASRWRRKNGVEDLRKCGHYLDRLIEIESQRGGMARLYRCLTQSAAVRVNLDEMFDTAPLSPSEVTLLAFLLYRDPFRRLDQLRAARDALHRVIDTACRQSPCSRHGDES